MTICRSVRQLPAYSRHSGYRVVLYESGSQFLESPPGAVPGCILLDWRMPSLGGCWPEVVDRRAAWDF